MVSLIRGRSWAGGVGGGEGDLGMETQQCGRKAIWYLLLAAQQTNTLSLSLNETPGHIPS